MKKRIEVPVSLLVAGVLALGVCAGCASSSSTTSEGFRQVTPAAYQPGPVELTTEEGYDILYSEKENSGAAVSLRSATNNYFQFYVAALNKGDDPRQISPDRIRLKFDGGGERTVSMYARSSIPSMLARDAQSDALAAAELVEATGRLYADESSASGAGAYGGAYGGEEDESGESQAVLLESSYLLAGDRVGGFVYAPAPGVRAGQFVIEVPVGDEMHRYRYTFE